MSGVFVFSAMLMLLVLLLSRTGISKVFFSLSVFMVGFSLWTVWELWQQILLFEVLSLLFFLAYILRKRKKRKEEKR